MLHDGNCERDQITLWLDRKVKLTAEERRWLAGRNRCFCLARRGFRAGESWGVSPESLDHLKSQLLEMIFENRRDIGRHGGAGDSLAARVQRSRMFGHPSQFAERKEVGQLIRIDFENRRRID